MQTICLKCGHPFEVDKSFVGKTVQCPACDAPFIVPDIPQFGASASLKTHICAQCGSADLVKQGDEWVCQYCGARNHEEKATPQNVYIYNDVSNQNKANPQSQFSYAANLLQNQLYQEAEAIYNNILKSDFDNLDARIGKAIAGTMQTQVEYPRFAELSAAFDFLLSHECPQDVMVKKTRDLLQAFNQCDKFEKERQKKYDELYEILEQQRNSWSLECSFGALFETPRGKEIAPFFQTYGKFLSQMILCGDHILAKIDRRFAEEHLKDIYAETRRQMDIYYKRAIRLGNEHVSDDAIKAAQTNVQKNADLLIAMDPDAADKINREIKEEKQWRSHPVRSLIPNALVVIFFTIVEGGMILFVAGSVSHFIPKLQDFIIRKLQCDGKSVFSVFLAFAIFWILIRVYRSCSADTVEAQIQLRRK